ncbi:MAG: NifU family protein [Bacteroidetes bacterium]|nr:NifU family protein [Bacteroidota bacterium]MBP9135580.1 NifU family protein [Chitinophagales bacterium]MBK7140105.1 NifU family protein [Bacteroidota bacterium]MBK7503795.1 NifU family protein [Bacteroidota bacterium]MBK7640554.1 NifU family protein [Bacteroidota bacterium]
MENEIKSTVPVMIYTEATPNPATLKFVVNRPLMPDDFVELQNLEEAKGAPLAVHLFELGQISTVFVSQNFITITKEEDVMWAEIMLPIKEKIKLYLESGQALFEEGFEKPKKATNQIHATDTDIEARIKGALDKYVKPAVEMDGGAISFVSFENGLLKLSLQGSCSGCPSSTVTLKQGIEGLMKRMVPEVELVEAVSE